MLSKQLSHSINFRHSIHLEIVRPLVHILREESRTLKTKLSTLKNVAEKGLDSYTLSLKQMSKMLTQLIIVHRRQTKEVLEVRALYRKETMQRKLLFNEVDGCGLSAMYCSCDFVGYFIQVQELRGNIRVFCRSRLDNRGRCGLQFDGDRIICTTAQGRQKVFEFERVYSPHTKQEQVLIT